MKTKLCFGAQMVLFSAALSSGFLAQAAYAQRPNTTPSKVAVAATAITPAIAAPAQAPRREASRSSLGPPSKVAVNAPALSAQAATPSSQSRENVPVLQASVSLSSPDEKDDLESLVRSLQSPSKVATAPSAAAAQANSAQALTAYLSYPTKTPIAALDANSARSINLAFDIQASSVLVVDQDSREVLYSKSPQDVMPIASITKLMTAMVVLDAKQNMSQRITITQADVDTLKNSSSRLVVGTKLTRRELLHLALMSSENRAAHALARNYPGGEKAFVTAMNNKAHTLGMTQTRYVGPTGLSSQNRSSARDLVWLVKAAYDYPLIRQWSTSSSYQVAAGRSRLNYINSNRLTDKSSWHIGLQKTGYIREAGHCLVMQASVAGRRTIMVFLNADGKDARMDDAEKMRDWLIAQSKQSNTMTASSRQRAANL